MGFQVEQVKLIKTTVGGCLQCSPSQRITMTFKPKSVWNLRQVHKGTAGETRDRSHKTLRKTSKECFMGSKAIERATKERRKRENLKIFPKSV